MVSGVSEGRPAATAPVVFATARRRLAVVQLIAWIAWIALSALYLRPLLNTTIVADDLVNPFSQFDVAGPALGSNLDVARDGVERAGHFNYLGQYLGAMYNQLWLRIASTTGVSLLALYALTKLVVFLGTALAVASFVRRVCQTLGRGTSAWQARVVVSACLFSTLQLHAVWSNDPVASYPLSGFASAALGFALLSAALHPDVLARTGGPWVLGALAALTVLYYEINVAAVLAVGVVLGWRAWSIGPVRSRLRQAVALSPAVLVPFVLTVGLALRAAPNSENYTGTAVAVGDGLLRTTAIGLLGGLPAAGWRLSRGYVGGPPLLLVGPLLVLALIGVVLVVLARRTPLGSTSLRHGSAWVLLLAPVLYGVSATLIQTSTAKVQAEVTQVGMVYNFYAISASAVASLLAFGLLLAPRRWLATPTVLATLVTGLGTLVVLQTLFNASISVQFNGTNQPQSRALLQSYSDQDPAAERCAAVAEWTALELPDYYEDGMVAGLQAAYRHYYGEPFCQGFVR